MKAIQTYNRVNQTSNPPRTSFSEFSTKDKISGNLCERMEREIPDLHFISSGMMLTLVLLLVTLSSQAQDYHFSQYFASPSNINPALTGITDGHMRVAANYRNQWFGSMPFRTYGISLDGNINRHIMDGNHLGVGASFFQDKYEGNGFINTNMNVSVAYNLKISGYPLQYIGLGIQTGMLSKTIDFNNDVFGNFYENGSNTDPLLNADLGGMKFDIGTGLSYFLSVREEHVFTFGLSAFHLNRPKFGHEKSDPLMIRYVAYTSAEIVMDKFIVIPTFLFQRQGPSMELNTGFYGGYILEKRKNNYEFYVGSQFRISRDITNGLSPESIIPAIRVKAYRTMLGLSWDFPLAELSQLSNGIGSPEVSLVFDLAFNDRKLNRGLKCPRF